ncbi:MAG: zf-HC2 domain-containing protein [Steroidobacteraceae bacterium]|jgi:anti-sigma factor RsiW
MPCADASRVQAYFDGEVDAVGAAEIERHLERCADCRALLDELEQLRAAIRRDLPYISTPPPLRASILRALDQESLDRQGAAPNARPRSEQPGSWRSRPFWKGAFSGFGATAVAASLAFLLLAPPSANPLLDELVNAHVRSLMPDHLIDVVSTDKHTVKPWFAGHTDVSPVVADFAEQGYRLVGGRADYFDHQRAAVVVYQHGSHLINVFSWAATDASLPKDSSRNGYHLAFWKAGNLAYCAVSDTGWDELRGLVQLLQDLGVHDDRQ